MIICAELLVLIGRKAVVAMIAIAAKREAVTTTAQAGVDRSQDRARTLQAIAITVVGIETAIEAFLATTVTVTTGAIVKAAIATTIGVAMAIRGV